MCFSVITKNLKREILTKNLVTFKRWNGVKVGKFKYFGCSLKNPICRGERCSRKPIYRGNCVERGGATWAVIRFKGAAWTWKKR